MAAMEERRETAQKFREARRTEKIARRHNRAYANVSYSVVRSIPLRQRMMELSTSASFAALATLLITLGLLFSSSFLTGVSATLFSALTLFGAWAVLGTAKFMEGGKQSWTNKRLVFLLAGALLSQRVTDAPPAPELAVPPTPELAVPATPELGVPPGGGLAADLSTAE